MLLAPIAVAAGLITAAAGYVLPPSRDGFPNPSAQQLLAIEQTAGGQLSNAPPPARLSAAGAANFQLIAFNEQFEAAFFASLLENITTGVPGYDWVSNHRTQAEIVEVLRTVQAQEELHALAATSTLQHFNVSLVPQPCDYTFPTTSLEAAIELANQFTSVVLGTLQDAEESFAENGDSAPVRLVSSVIGQEGEQQGFYRFLLGRKPSEKPFLTTSTGPFAFSALQQFVVSCPFDVTAIPIPILPPLTVVTTPAPRDMNLTFSADLSSVAGQWNATSDLACLSLTYLVGQQLPVSVPIANVSWAGDVLTFGAELPYTAYQMDGFNLAALTNASGFATADDVVANTLAAPGLIQVNDLLQGYKK
ncbi:late sexual development protein [Xylariaceae sp. FL0804]|nr:late sexual development protein [Xylariaceae sp. FL0804]